MDSSAFTVLSICTGGGGLDFGIRLAIPDARPVCHVEIEAFCCEILASRMEEKLMAETPIWTDLKTFDGKPWSGLVDCIIGGYPCQGFSVAGKRQGKKDPRYLWPHVSRIVKEVKPTFVFFENVSNHLSIGFDIVRKELQEMGYLVEAGIFSAKEMGFSHLRKRLFILGILVNATGERRREKGVRQDSRGTYRDGSSVDNALCRRRRDSQEEVCTGRDPLIYAGNNLALAGQDRLSPPGPSDLEGWVEVISRDETLKPSLCIVADGLASELVDAIMENRPEQLRTLGNGVVPACAAFAFSVLLDRLLPRDQETEKD